MKHTLNNYKNTAKVLEDCPLQSFHLGAGLSQVSQPWLKLLWECLQDKIYYSTWSQTKDQIKRTRRINLSLVYCIIGKCWENKFVSFIQKKNDSPYLTCFGPQLYKSYSLGLAPGDFGDISKNCFHSSVQCLIREHMLCAWCCFRDLETVANKTTFLSSTSCNFMQMACGTDQVV